MQQIPEELEKQVINHIGYLLKTIFYSSDLS